jgi:Ca-activated chloride channel homolog
MYRFEHIEALYLLVGTVFILLLYFTYKQWKQKKFKILAEAHLLEHIVKGRSKSKTTAKFIISLIIFALLIFSLANLQIGGKLDKQAQSETIDMILAIDISHSMLAEDMKPNRIERAKFIAMKLAEEVRFAKIGIVLFAGDAYIHMPVTSDPGAVRMFIHSIGTDLISLQGTAIGQAIQVATEAFNRTEARNKAVIIISDGENFEDDAIQATSLAAENNIVIHSISIGTADGGPIPIKENGKIIGFKRDQNDNTVVTKPDFELLSQVASKTGGISVDGNQPGFAVTAITDELKKLEREQGESMQFADWDSLYYLFAIPALILLIIDFLIIERKMRWQQIFDSLLNFSITKKQNSK